VAVEQGVGTPFRNLYLSSLFQSARGSYVIFLYKIRDLLLPYSQLTPQNKKKLAILLFCFISNVTATNYGVGDDSRVIIEKIVRYIYTEEWEVFDDDESMILSMAFSQFFQMLGQCQREWWGAYPTGVRYPNTPSLE